MVIGNRQIIQTKPIVYKNKLFIYLNTPEERGRVI
jgi:hypothetical protein